MKKDESLKVKMTSDMRDWLQEKAEAKDSTLARVVRQCIASAMNRDQKKRKTKK